MLVCEYEKDLTELVRIRLKQAEELYSLYPKKYGRGRAIEAIKGALRKVAFGTLRQRVIEYSHSSIVLKGYTLNPDKWFNDEHWLDDPKTWNQDQQSSREPIQQDTTPEEKRKRMVEFYRKDLEYKFFKQNVPLKTIQLILSKLNFTEEEIDYCLEDIRSNPHA